MKTTNPKSCYLCGKKVFTKVDGQVRDLPRMPILRCSSCGLVFLANFDHINEGFYENSNMRRNDPVADWKRYLSETAEDDQRRTDSLRKWWTGKRILDVGCGAGGFLARVKRYASQVAGVEKDVFLKRKIKNLFSIQVFGDLDQVKGRYDRITLFHVLEHFKNPVGTLTQLKRNLSTNGLLIVEVPNMDDALLSLYQCKAFSRWTHWKCHLYGFTAGTLREALRQAGFTIRTLSQFQRYPLSNHLHWLSQGKPGGHEKWKFLSDSRLDREYARLLAKIGACDTLIAVAKLK